MIETSENIADISKALVKAQGLVKGAGKDSTNPGFKSRYASLEAVVEAAKPALQAAGIAFTQAPGAVLETGAIEVTTMLLHGDSGQWMRSTLHVLLGKRDPQGIGSAITYGCRYSLMAVLGIPPVDDDGDEGAKETHKPLSSAHAKTIIKTEVIQAMIDGATTTKAADDAAARIREYAAFMPGAWIKAFDDRLDHQRDLITKGGVVDEPPNAMDQAYADTMREDAPRPTVKPNFDALKTRFKDSIEMERAAADMEATKSPEALKAVWDAEVEQQFEGGEARERLQAVYAAKIRTFGVGADA